MVEASLSEHPEHKRKLMQELTPLFLYGILGKPGPGEMLHEK